MYGFDSDHLDNQSVQRGKVEYRFQKSRELFLFSNFICIYLYLYLFIFIFIYIYIFIKRRIVRQINKRTTMNNFQIILHNNNYNNIT